MKILGFFLILTITAASSFHINSIHQFKIKALDSEEIIDFQSFKGKKILVINVASKCGYTSQYADLEKLYQSYKDELVVIGFPCNQFMGQEPGTEEEIAQFCSSSYGVTFPMTTKVSVKGKDQHEIYRWLTQKKENHLGDFKVKWNFNKFLVDEKGELIAHFPSKVKPMSDEILRYLK